MESLGIDIKLLIAQIINFALFFYIFKRFIAKPFSNFLNIEQKKEEEKEKILQELKRKEEEMIKEQEKAREKIGREIDLAIKNAKVDALQVREDLITDAKEEAEEILTRAAKQTAEEKEAMHKEIKKKIADLSVLIVNRALSQFLTPDVQKTIIRHILRNLPKDIS